jgi:hypothetical protein
MTRNNPRSSSGRTADFDSAYGGSNPSLGIVLDRPVLPGVGMVRQKGRGGTRTGLASLTWGLSLIGRALGLHPGGNGSIPLGSSSLVVKHTADNRATQVRFLFGAPLEQHRLMVRHRVVISVTRVRFPLLLPS